MKPIERRRLVEGVRWTYVELASEFPAERIVS